MKPTYTHAGVEVHRQPAGDGAVEAIELDSYSETLYTLVCEG